MKKEFIKNIQGKDFVLHEGLLNEFHENGGKEISTEMLALKDNVCVFKATVTGEKGVFTGHGDASKTNVNSMIAPHFIRMAETRAVNRALRFYNNIGMCSVDELGGEDVKPTPQNDIVHRVAQDSKCPKCGAPMKVSQKGSMYCSALCWKQKESPQSPQSNGDIIDTTDYSEPLAPDDLPF